MKPLIPYLGLFLFFPILAAACGPGLDLPEKTRVPTSAETAPGAVVTEESFGDLSRAPRRAGPGQRDARDAREHAPRPRRGPGARRSEPYGVAAARGPRPGRAAVESAARGAAPTLPNRYRR